jgi:hypothetical protein
MSGSKDSHRILTFDWTNMEYTKHTSQLIGSRKRSACALLKGSDGVVLVAVASGYSAGMEVWNPADDSVKMLTSDFPKYASEFPQLISVNYHSELIFYESYSPSKAKGIDQCFSNRVSRHIFVSPKISSVSHLESLESA